MKLRRVKKHGFTLLELMIASAILIVALTGLLGIYVACLELNETTKNTNLALTSAQRLLEEVRDSDFQHLQTSYNNYTFQVSGTAANASLGYVNVTNVSSMTNVTLYEVTIGVCWRQKAGRVIGECQESGGALNFSDNNSNGRLDSPVELTTLMSAR